MNDLSLSDLNLNPAINHISEASSLDIYSQQLAKFGLLSAAEEQALGKRINAELAEIIKSICSTSFGLEKLFCVIETYLQSYQSNNGKATKRWKYELEPSYIANLAFTLIDTLEVQLLLKERSKEHTALVQNLISLLQSLSLGRQQIIEIANSLHSESDALAKHLYNYQTLRGELVQKNLRLVYTVAGRFRSSGVTYEDLIQEGNIGLLKAADRFNFNKGFRFSTYAYWCIQNVLKTALQKRYHTISRPSYLQEKLSIIKKVKSRYVSKHGKHPSINTLATISGIPIGTLEKINSFPSEPLSLSQGLGSDDQTTSLEGVLADEHTKTEELSEKTLKRRLLDRICNKLTEREYLVLKLRFGIDARREHTLEEISYQLGVSVERIRQMQKAALTKLQQYDKSDLQVTELI